ncbi:MAG: 2-oxoacid:acceptor oxidoreductase family protein [Deltaproteobacteria bacterium]
MTYNIIFSGFGGQGILSAGKLVAQAAMLEGKNVSWLPSYGPEKRGGTSNCHVIVSDEPVGSPYITSPNLVIAMSKQAFDKYEEIIAEQGIMIYDGNAVSAEPSRDDLKYYKIPATQMAIEAGFSKLANVIFLGKLIGVTDLVKQDYIIEALKEILPEQKHYLIPDEIKLLKMGMDYEA